MRKPSRKKAEKRQTSFSSARDEGLDQCEAWRCSLSAGMKSVSHRPWCFFNFVAPFLCDSVSTFCKCLLTGFWCESGSVEVVQDHVLVCLFNDWEHCGDGQLRWLNSLAWLDTIMKTFIAIGNKSITKTLLILIGNQ